MASNIYLKIEGIQGDSTDAQHKDEIRVNSFQWAEAEITSGGGGAGGAVGKTEFGNLTVHISTSSASPKLFLACASGEHFLKAVLTAEKAGGAHPAPYLTITLQDVLIASFAIDCEHAPDVPNETVGMSFSKIQWEYRKQNPDGSSGTPVATGWDIRQQKAF